MLKLSTTDFRFRTALVVAAGLMSLSGFTNQGEVRAAKQASTMASTEAPLAQPQSGTQGEMPVAKAPKANAPAPR